MGSLNVLCQNIIKQYESLAGAISNPPRSPLPSSSCCGCWLLMARMCTSFLRLSLADGSPRPGDTPTPSCPSHSGVALSNDWRMKVYNSLVALPLHSFNSLIQFIFLSSRLNQAEIFPESTCSHLALSPALSHLPHTPAGFSWECSFSTALAQASASESAVGSLGWVRQEREVAYIAGTERVQGIGHLYRGPAPPFPPFLLLHLPSLLLLVTS